jgi:nucleoside 2-deoxyribosyltransferase
MPPDMKGENAGRRVYLAGPPFAEEYRRRAAALLCASGLEPVDPMRHDFREHTAGHERDVAREVRPDLDEAIEALVRTVNRRPS